MPGNNPPGNNAIYTPIEFIPEGLQSIQLDIVGFLAVLGEGSVLSNAQVSALSKWVFLPRLIPAPQALIRNSRPDRLQGVTDRMVIGAESGNIRPQLNHVAHILHSRQVASGDALDEYSVRVIRLRELGGKDEDIKVHAFSPLTFLALLGCFMSVALIIFSALQGDGPALAATVVLSLLSTLVGSGSYWHIQLGKRKARRHVPPTDIIIYYRHGAFLIVKDCPEELARKLYFAPEKCNYLVNEQAYRAIALLGTVLLMGGVILLANANTYLQLAYAGAYIILNAAYWIVAALPQHWNWDLSNFIVTPIRVHKSFGEFPDEEKNGTFTEALWHVIAVTRASRWARISGAAPNTEVWDEWLRRAEEAANAPGRDLSSKNTGFEKEEELTIPAWDPVQAYTTIMEAAQNAA